MPIYEYLCDACGEQMEALQRMSDDKLVDCPACGKPALKRLVSAAAFRLKGAGWYETDFKKDNKRNLADSNSSTTASSSSDTGSGANKSDAGSTPAAEKTKKADPKPAAKAAAKSDSA
jgi:putative FmdB family regulatory protein